jgi:hypothetical protein
MRLVVGRSATLPAAGHPALSDIARRLTYAAAGALLEELESRMRDIRAAYERVMESKSD